MGHLCFNHMCVVVDIVDEVLLGEDPLLCDSPGPANIIQSEDKMMFRGANIPLKMARPSIVRCVTTAESVEVPPMEEVIVDAYMDRHANQEGEEGRKLLVEMHPDLSEGYGCVLAPSMVDVASGTMVPVHVFYRQSYLVVI